MRPDLFELVDYATGLGLPTALSPSVTPAEDEDICHFLFDASQHGFIVRTVEAPFFRRVVARRRVGVPAPTSAAYKSLSARLETLMGPPAGLPRAQTASTRDGKGIVFVAYDGEVYPAGFLPLGLGNVCTTPLAEIYRDDPQLKQIRDTEFSGRCGSCEYADLCGGSRARAFASSGDPLGEDLACPFRAGVAAAAALVDARE